MQSHSLLYNSSKKSQFFLLTKGTLTIKMKVSLPVCSDSSKNLLVISRHMPNTCVDVKDFVIDSNHVLFCVAC